MDDRPTERHTPGSRPRDETRDELFGVLADSRRRIALEHLEAAETPVSLEELARAVRAREDRRTGQDVEAVAIALVHAHLPKMVEAGVVRCDGSRQVVALADRADEVRPHLPAASD